MVRESEIPAQAVQPETPQEGTSSPDGAMADVLIAHISDLHLGSMEPERYCAFILGATVLFIAVTVACTYLPRSINWRVGAWVVFLALAVVIIPLGAAVLDNLLPPRIRAIAALCAAVFLISSFLQPLSGWRPLLWAAAAISLLAACIPTTVLHNLLRRLSTIAARDSAARFDRAANELAARHPHLILVTGDVVNHPVRQHLLDARIKLESLCVQCGIVDESGKADKRRLVVIPGNHDYRPFGSFWNWKKPFTDVFGNWSEPRRIVVNGRQIFVYCFDSNQGNLKVNAAGGRVGSAEYARFRTAHRDNGGPAKSANSFSIAVLHHHPMAIAETEAGLGGAMEMVHLLEDGGTFLQEMAAGWIDLVLHGHKHCPSVRKTVFLTADRDENQRTVPVVAAGSFSHPGASRPGYNFIRIRPSGVVEVLRVEIVDGALEDPRKINLIDINEAARRRYAAASHTCGERLNALVCDLKVNTSGECHYALRYKGLRVVKDEAVASVADISERLAPPGWFDVGSDAVRITDPSETLGTVCWRPASESSSQHLEGYIEFASPLESNADPVTFTLQFSAHDAFAFSREQLRRMDPAASADHVEALCPAVRRPTRELTMTVDVPGTAVLNGVDAIVKDSRNQLVLYEARRCQKQILSSGAGRVVTMSVKEPFLQHRYGLLFHLGSETAVKSKIQTFKTKCDAVKRDLLGSAAQKALQLALRTERDRFLKKYRQLFSTTENETSLDLSLMIFDDLTNPGQRPKLRLVASVIPVEGPVGLYEGQGVAGHAHKTGQPVRWYVHQTDQAAVYARIPGTGDHKAIVSVPLWSPTSALTWQFGWQSGWVVAVLSVASTAEDTFLVDERLDTTALVTDLVAVWKTRILPLAVPETYNRDRERYLDG